MSADTPQPSASRVALVFRTDGPDFPTPLLVDDSRLAQFPPVGTLADALELATLTSPCPPQPESLAGGPAWWVVDMGAILSALDARDPSFRQTLAGARAWHHQAVTSAVVAGPNATPASTDRQHRVRQQLITHRMPHSVVYTAPDALPQALGRWIASLEQVRRFSDDPTAPRECRPTSVVPWRHLCGRCGDPSCERALFPRFAPKDR